MRKISKTFLALLIALTMCIGSFNSQAYASSNESINIYVNEQQVIFKDPQIKVGDYVLAPITPVTDLYGAEVRWNAELRAVTLAYSNIAVGTAMDNRSIRIQNTTTGMEQISSLPVAPMLYNGISYFPIEAIMRTLGATISWDAPTRTLKIMTPNFIPSDVIPPSTAPTILPSATVPAAPAATAAPATPTATETPAVNSQTMLIRDIEPYRLENMIAFTEEEPSWMMGASYPYAFSTDGSREINEGNAYFNLGGSYYSISGLYGPRDSTQSRSFLTVLNIYGDTRLLATYEILTEDGIKSFTLNVAGVSQLRFEFLCMDSEGKRANVDSAFVDNRSWYFGLANVVLTKSGDAKTYANQPLGVYGATATLSQEIKLYRKSSNMAELTRAAAGTIMGNEYSSGFATISNEYFANGFAYYNINNKYKSFSASYGPLDSTAQGSAVILQVYGGDTLLNEYTIKSGEPLRELYLDVTGVTRLRFRFWQIDADGKNIDRRGCAFAVVNPTLR